ncbi:hypothetical protein FRC18_011081 [Serendipita sp. 400]|nr:hypothetical protein FRC18_011081 [Serendipita sp. 400]
MVSRPTTNPSPCYSNRRISTDNQRRTLAKEEKTLTVTKIGLILVAPSGSDPATVTGTSVLSLSTGELTTAGTREDGSAFFSDNGDKSGLAMAGASSLLVNSWTTSSLLEGIPESGF